MPNRPRRVRDTHLQAKYTRWRAEGRNGSDRDGGRSGGPNQGHIIECRPSRLRRTDRDLRPSRHAALGPVAAPSRERHLRIGIGLDPTGGLVHDVELPVDANTAQAEALERMLRLRVYLDGPTRSLELDPRANSCPNGVYVNAAGLLHGELPQINLRVRCLDRVVRHAVRTELGSEPFDERLIARCVDALEVTPRRQVALDPLRQQVAQLVLADTGGDDR